MQCQSCNPWPSVSLFVLQVNSQLLDTVQHKVALSQQREEMEESLASLMQVLSLPTVLLCPLRCLNCPLGRVGCRTASTSPAAAAAAGVRAGRGRSWSGTATLLGTLAVLNWIVG